MRKPLIAAALLSTSLFAGGYVIGQVRGPATSSAASVTPTTQQTQPEAAPDAARQQLGPRADGTVTAVNGDTITVKADSDQGQTGEFGNVTTIVLSSSTVYEADHDSTTTASKASVKVGTYIIARGTLGGDGKTLTASQVSVRPSGPDGQNGPHFEAPTTGSSTSPGA